MKKKWMIKVCMDKDYHYGAPKEYARTKLGAWIKSLKWRNRYDHVKIERSYI